MNSNNNSNENLIYEKGLNFGCQRCSFCCGHGPGVVYLSRRDLEELCKFHQMETLDFIEKYCRWVMYYGGIEVLALQEKKNYDCILWENGCSCYESRPIQCSTYPFWSWMIESKEMWDDCAKDCPGMNKGRLWSKEEILEQKKLFDDNLPLSKDEFQLR